MQQIISTAEKLVLHTGMSDREFAQANMMQHMKANGYLAILKTGESGESKIEQGEPSTKGGSNNAGGQNALSGESPIYDFEPWTFEQTAMDGENFIIEGPAFNGTTMFDILSKIESENEQKNICYFPLSQSQKYWQKILYVLHAMAQAQKQGIKLPNVGAIGILIDENNNILFLPEILLSRSVAMISQKEAINYAESWRMPLLPEKEIFSFTAATMLYCAICGTRAFFGQANLDELTQDFLDKNFLPIQYNACIKAEIAQIINNALTGKINFRPSVKRMLEILPNNLQDAFISNEENEKTCNNQNRSKISAKIEKSIKRIRFFRKNFNAIAISCLALVGISAIALSVINGNLSKPKTNGMTSFQVAESFYTGINQLNTNFVDATTTNKAGKRVSDMVSSLFVVAKMQNAYEQTLGYLPPAEWLNLWNEGKKLEDNQVFGITNLKINGVVADCSANWFETVDKSELTGVEGETAEINAHYFQLSSLEESNFEIEEFTDTLTLKFENKKWLITNVNRQSTPVLVNAKEFYKDFYNGNTEKYEWFPTSEELETGKTDLKERFSTASAL